MIPHNEELEKAIIGATFVDRSVSWDAKQLSTADFYIGLNRAIWSIVCELDEEHQPIDITVIHSRLKESFAVTLAELMQLTVGVPINWGTGREVAILKTLAAQRTLHKGFTELAEKSQAKESVETIIERAETLIASIKQEQSAEKGTSRILADVYEKDVFPRLDKFVAGQLVKLPFGWETLDGATGGGSSPGELVILGAKPKSGKSALMLQIAMHQSRQNIGCYIVSREMLNYENAFRAIAQTSNYSVNYFRAGLYDTTAERVKSHCRETGGVPLHLDDKAKTVKGMRKELDRIENSGVLIQSVFVDYIQLMRGIRQRNNTAELIEDIIYDLKDLAMERDLVVYANAQFNRDGIDSERPKMSDFKGSSAIEMAGNLILLWTLEQDVNADAGGRKGSLWIEAGRNVPYDEFNLVFRGEKALFGLSKP